MRILDWGHVPESALAEMADDPEARQRLSPSERRHLDACDRCLGLLEGHRRTTKLFAATWQFVAADQPATEHGVQRVHSVVSAGGVGPVRSWHPVWLVIGLLLLSALVGTALIGGARRASVEPPPAVVAGPSEAASQSPRPSQNTSPSAGPYIVDTSTWSKFVSARHGLTISYPPLWTVVPARTPWNLTVDQSAGFGASTDSFLHPDAAATFGKEFAAYGTALPKDMTYAAFIEAYLAPNRARMDDGCVPPPSEWEPITIDGHDAGLAIGCGYQEAMVLAGARVYIFSGYGDMSRDRALFDAFLSTVHLDPTAADDTPGGPSPSSSG